LFGVGELHVNPHVPALHVAFPLPDDGPGQLAHDEPQWVGSLPTSKQVLLVPHLEYPVLQEKPQLLFEHVELEFGTLLGHLFPQAPQLFTSWPVLAQ